MDNKPELRLINMADVEATDVQWLWYPYIPYGKITIIQGDPGEGKTTLVLNLAAILSRGEKLPETDTDIEPVNIIYQTAEDGLSDTVKPRLIAANAKLIILDPIQAYIGASVDMNRPNEIRDIMTHLKFVAEKYQCAVILIGHLNKATGMKASYRGLGSVDIQAAARSVLLVGRVKDNPTIRVMAPTKSSLAPEGEPIAFELNKETGFHFIGKYDI
ncbi:MAG: AAA family ATPase, partial [Clostridia bacterium]|nr:AAA family ATPase [Clostridia bacterium]